MSAYIDDAAIMDIYAKLDAITDLVGEVTDALDALAYVRLPDPPKKGKNQVTQDAFVLRAAAHLLEDKGWTQDYLAKDIDGNQVNFDSEEAVCFCASGAIHRVSKDLATALGSDDWNTISYPLLRTIEDDLFGHHSLPSYNDKPDRTVEDVTSLFRRKAAELG